MAATDRHKGKRLHHLEAATFGGQMQRVGSHLPTTRARFRFRTKGQPTLDLCKTDAVGATVGRNVWIGA